MYSYTRYTSYSDYVKSKLPNKSDVKLLDSKTGNCLHLPSAGVYYNLYPYKVVLSRPLHNTTDYYEQRRETILRRLDYDSFISDLCTSGNRIVISTKKSKDTVYFRKYTDLCMFTNFYNQYVSEIYGPISHEHVDMLMDIDTHVAVRKPYWNQYDCKVWVGYDFTSYLTRKLRSGERQTMVAEACVFMQDNLNTYKNIYGRSNIFSEFYGMIEEIDQITPFLKLQYPEVRLILTKCLLK